jgi:hypothetical protein
MLIMRNYAKTIGSLFVIPLFVLVGCGGGDNNNTGGSGGNGGSGGSGGSSVYDDFAAKAKAATCGNAVECHRSETEAECIATSGGPEDVTAYLANGTVIYNPDNAAACIAALGTVNGCSYGELLPLLANGGDSIKELCASVFEGTVADGGNCTSYVQCVSHACEPVDPACADACCPGKCVMGMPVPALAKIGESCVMAPCESSAYCQTDPNTGASTTCAALLAAGAACTDLGACAAPNLCNVDLMTGMGTCKKAPATGETCDPMGIFSCDRMDDFCDMTTKKCTPLGLVGATCADTNDCVRYAHCDMGTMKCAKDFGEGQACDPMNNDCLGNLQCLSTGKCSFGTPPPVCK